MSDQINISATGEGNFSKLESAAKKAIDPVERLSEACLKLLGAIEAVNKSASQTDLKNFTKNMNKELNTPSQRNVTRAVNRAARMDDEKFLRALPEIRELSKANLEIAKALNHLSPEEIGLKKSGQKIATANTQLGWAKLENQQDRFFKYSNNFIGGLASNLQMMNSRIMNSGGLMGFMGRLGYRMSNNKNGFWSSAEYKGIDKKTGKPIYGDLPKHNINNLFNGALAKATGGKGINFGPMAMMAPVAAVAGVAALGKAIYNLGEEAKVATGQIQAIKTQMSIVMGSGTIAENIYSGVEKFALKSPFGVETSADMAALLKQSGVNATDLLKTLRMIGDTSSGNAEKMKRVANNYAQIQAIGKASMLDMRQFAYAGIPIYKEVAEYMKVSQQELRKMISEGKVTANIIEAVFERMTGKGGVFENATMRGAQTIAARTQNLMDAQMIARAQFGQTYMNAFGSGYGDGFGNNVLNLKESIASDIASIFGRMNTERAGNDAISLLTKIESYTHSIDGKMPLNVKDKDFYTNKKIVEFLLNQAGGEEKVWGDLAKLAKADQIVIKKTDNEFGDNEKIVKGGYFLGREKWSKETERAFEEITKQDWWGGKIKDDVLLKHFLDPLTKYAWEQLYTHITPEDYQKRYREMAEDSKRNERADYLYQGYARGEVAIAARAIMDSVDSGRKKGVNSEVTKSMQDLTAQFNTEFKNSYAGKVEEELKKRNEWKVYSQTYDKFAKYQDENNKLLIDNIKTLSELRTVLDSGIFNINMMDIAKMSDDDFKTASKNFSKAMDFASMQYAENQQKKGNYKNTVFSNSEDFRLFSAIQVALNNGRKPITEVSDFLNLANGFSDQEKKDLLATIFGDITGDKKAKRYTHPELWKMYAGSILGLDPEKMKTPVTLNGKKYNMTPDEILKFWSEGFAKRDLVKSMIPALMASNETRNYNSKTGKWEQRGFSLKEISGAYVTDKNGVVNWGDTVKNMENMAFSQKASVSSLETYAKALDAQTAKMKELYVSLSTGGENRAEMLLGKNLTEELKTALSNTPLELNGKKINYIDGKYYYEGTKKELTDEEIKSLGNNSVVMAKLTETTENLINTNNNLKDTIAATIDAKNFVDNYNAHPGYAKAFADAFNFGSDVLYKKPYAVQRMAAEKWNNQSKATGVYTERKTYLRAQLDDLAGKILRGEALSSSDKRIKRLLEKSNIAWGEYGSPQYYKTAEGETKEKRSIGFILNDTGDKYTNESTYGKLSEEVLKLATYAEEADLAFVKLGESIKNAFSQNAMGLVNNTMAKFGENIAKGVAGYEDMDKVVKQLGKSLMSNLAAAATQAGLSLISSGRIGAGMALIAAGGMASFLGGLMTDSSDKEDDITQKLKDLKQDLADLLKQAREDAIYYENHLRHTNALSYNSAVSKTTKVNDAIITPQGNVITTHPEDYLIASKNPSGLMGGGSPIVNIDIQNNSGKKIEMKQSAKANGSGGIDVVAIIEEAVGDYVSSSRSDDAFAAREARLRGRSVSA